MPCPTCFDLEPPPDADDEFVREVSPEEALESFGKAAEKMGTTMQAFGEAMKTVADALNPGFEKLFTWRSRR